MIKCQGTPEVIVAVLRMSSRACVGCKRRLLRRIAGGLGFRLRVSTFGSPYQTNSRNASDMRDLSLSYGPEEPRFVVVVPHPRLERSTPHPTPG